MTNVPNRSTILFNVKIARPGSYCSSCERVPTQVVEIFSGYRQLHWFCSTCETQICHSAYDQLAAKSVSHEGITKQLSEVQTQVQKLVDQVNV